MGTMPVVAIVGKSGVGKTHLMERLIQALKASGYRVASVKHSHHAVDVDSCGKDTWRFSKAGSDATVISSAAGLTIFKNLNHEPDLRETVMLLGPGYDIVLAEGFKKSDLPKIEVKDSGQRGLLCEERELLAVVSDEELSISIPRFPRDDIEGIAHFIEQEIILKTESDMAVTVNGKPVAMKPFVKEIIAESVLAMLGTLKNTGIIESVAVFIKKKR